MAGLIEDKANICTQSFKRAGDLIVLLGETKGAEAASSSVIHGVAAGVRRSSTFTWKAGSRSRLAAVRGGIVSSAHRSEGGLAVTLAECCILGGLGAEVALEQQDLSPAQLLLRRKSQPHSGVVGAWHLVKFRQMAEELSVPVNVIGKVSGKLQIRERLEIRESKC